MYASTPTKLDLPTWARIMGLHPLHFAQVTWSPEGDTDNTPSCSAPWVQHEWQGADSASREEIARVIFEAEEAIERELGYRLLPSWEKNEWHPTTRPWRPELFNLSNTDLRGFAQSVHARWGYFHSGGVKAQSLIAAARPIVYTDADADGYFETATITFTDAAVTGLDACQVHAYYPGKAGAPGFEVRPISASVSGTTLTVVVRRELLVKEEFIEGYGEINGVDGEENAAFLTTLDLYRVYNDISNQGTLLWENMPGSCNCGNDGCAICQYSAQTACLSNRGDPRLGDIAFWPATYDADAATYSRSTLAIARGPDGVRMNYYAGLTDEAETCIQTAMPREWQIRVARFAAALLDRPPCGCVSELWNRWAQDLAASGGAEELSTYNVSKSDLENPFGTRRGMIYAWKKVAQDGMANARAVVVR